MDIKDSMKKIKYKTEEIFPLDELEEKIKNSVKKNKPLNIKLGVDPTAPDLHLGHVVVLRKLRDFQSLGHNVILIIGDFTARIGDPSERAKTRPDLSGEEIDKNAETYAEQAFRILDKKKTKIVYNNNWLSKLNFEDIIRLTSNFTVARILERDDFQKRYRQEKSISLHEFLYPVMQAYDSVYLKADIEIGGTDQKFNLLAGRQLQQATGQLPQVCVTMPILPGVDGIQRMSKSVGNYIGVEESPREMFGKTMSIPDSSIVQWLRLATEVPENEVADIEKGLLAGKLHPGEQKRRLAREIVALYYSKETAKDVEVEFDRIFKHSGRPDEINEIKIIDKLSSEEIKEKKVWIVKLLTLSELVPSNREARRLIESGSVKLNDEIIGNDDIEINLAGRDGIVLQVGKRRFCKLLFD